MGHMKDRCWKKGKDSKVSSNANNYLDSSIDDEEAMLEQLNRLCGTKHDFFRAKILSRNLLVEAIEDDREIIYVELGKGSEVR
jgi:hypothetical protein